jgi:hypothetical protein
MLGWFSILCCNLESGVCVSTQATEALQVRGESDTKLEAILWPCLSATLKGLLFMRIWATIVLSFA